MISPEEHRLVREMLGAFALGQISEPEGTAVRSHLDGCASCRAELSAIAPLAAPLKLIDPGRLSDAPMPPSGLDETILARIKTERRAPSARARRWAVPLAAAAAVGVFGAGVGYWVAPRPPAIPLESVAVEQSAPGIRSNVDVVPHTWGMEIKLTATGFARGKTYRVMVTDAAGGKVSAGEFIGTGSKEMHCNLNSSVLRTDAAGFQVLDPANRPVLSARL